MFIISKQFAFEIYERIAFIYALKSPPVHHRNTLNQPLFFHLNAQIFVLPSLTTSTLERKGQRAI